MILTINGQQAAIKKGLSIEYVSENRIFTDADDYNMEIELPLADCPQNIAIFDMITRKDVDMGDIFFDKVSFCRIKALRAGNTGRQGFDLEA